MNDSAGPQGPKKDTIVMYPKLGLWIGIIGLLMIGALCLVTVQIVQQDHDDEVRNIVTVQSNIAKAMEAHVLDIMDDSDNMLLFMKRAYERYGFISADTRELLEETNFSRFTSQAAVLDARGNFLFSMRTVLPGVNVADRPYFQAHIERDSEKPFLGSVVLGRVSGVTSFHLSRRLNNPDGSFGGVVVLAIGTEYFAEAFNRTTLEKMNFFLVGQDGVVRATDAVSTVMLGKNIQGGSAFQAIRSDPQSGTYVAKVMYLDVRRFVSYRAIKGYPLYVGVATDEDVALGRFYERRKVYYGMAGLVSAILIVMMTVLRHLLQRQVQLGLTIMQERAELLRMAATDSLTGLNNRRSFLEKGRRDFEVARRYERPLSLLMIDIDCFKKINDVYGHAAGDQVLVRLADVFRTELRSVDLCGRFGGEEFVCLLPETPVDKARVEAERLRKSLAEQTVATTAGEISFTVSIGVSTADAEGDKIEALIHRADTAMYTAKRAGRNRVVVG